MRFGPDDKFWVVYVDPQIMLSCLIRHILTHGHESMDQGIMQEKSGVVLGATSIGDG